MFDISIKNKIDRSVFVIEAGAAQFDFKLFSLQGALIPMSKDGIYRKTHGGRDKSSEKEIKAHGTYISRFSRIERYFVAPPGVYSIIVTYDGPINWDHHGTWMRVDSKPSRVKIN